MCGWASHDKRLNWVNGAFWVSNWKLWSFKTWHLFASDPNREGVKLEFVRNSFYTIQKFAIRLIRKGKKYSKNLMKINSKFVQFDSTPIIGVEPNFQKLEFVRNLFNSIWKFAFWLIRKAEKNSKNSMKINSKFVRFDSTPTIGWNQIFRNWNSFQIRSIWFKNLQFNRFERWKKFDNNQFKIHLIRFYPTPTLSLKVSVLNMNRVLRFRVVICSIQHYKD